jgi:hypothetical protein
MNNSLLFFFSILLITLIKCNEGMDTTFGITLPIESQIFNGLKTEETKTEFFLIRGFLNF